MALTPRQQEIKALVWKYADETAEKTSKELKITPDSVKKHIGKIKSAKNKNTAEVKTPTKAVNRGTTTLTMTDDDDEEDYRANSASPYIADARDCIFVENNETGMDELAWAPER